MSENTWPTVAALVDWLDSENGTIAAQAGVNPS